jgi:hypothetical protein
MNARRLTLLLSATALVVFLLAVESGAALAVEGYVLKASFGSTGSGAGQFEEPIGVAVNDSSEPVPGAGDVYVVDRGNARVERFNDEGKYELQFNGSDTPAKGFSSPAWIAIDDSGKPSLEDPSVGDVYVADTGHKVVDKFSPAGVYEGQLTGTCPAPGPCAANEVVPFHELLAVAVDQAGNLWVYERNGEFEGTIAEFDDGGGFVKSLENVLHDTRAAQPGGLGLDSMGNFYVTAGNSPSISVVELDSATAEIAAEYSRASSNVTALAVAPTSNRLLLDDGDRLQLYGPFGETSETPLSVTEGLAESDGVAVSAAGIAYAASHAANDVEVFKLGALPPGVAGEAVSRVGSTEARVSASINAELEPTTYHVEYGTSERYGASTPEVSSGAAGEPVSVLTRLSGLQPGAEYHFRFVATNANGRTIGADATFTTPASAGASASLLPDERVYELVSTANGPGEVYAPTTPIEQPEDTYTEELFEAAPSGDAVVYMGDPGLTGGDGATGGGLGNQWLATRSSEGWMTSDITPVGGNAKTEYEAFTSDLSTGFVETNRQPPLTPAAPAKCQVLYARSSAEGAYDALLTATQTPGECGNLYFGGASADASQVLFESQAALTGNAQESEKAAGYERRKGGPGLGEPCEFGCNLYDSVGGRMRLVNEGTPSATFGGLSYLEGNGPDLSNAISIDGSRIFWTDTQAGPDLGHIYVLENGEKRVPVSGEGVAKYWTATPDGRYAFYTEDEKLWRFDTTLGTREVLAGVGLKGESAGVQGVVGINSTGEDGAYVYFIAEGRLSSGAEKLICKTAVRETHEREEQESIPPEERRRLGAEMEAEEYRHELPPDRGCNLYLLHQGEPVKLVATLSPRDDELQGSGTSGVQYGDWVPNLGNRTAEVTPDGRHLVFESSSPLTGYSNVDAAGGERALEVFAYAADTGRLACASCNPTGAPPQSQYLSSSLTLLPVSSSGTYMPRWISEDGNRVFFDSSDSLVSQDTNGVQDVYEWEREGASSCPESTSAKLDGGCVFLLSGGESSDYSFLVDASANGNDVFFTTRAQLVAHDRDEKTDLYDARVAGGFPEYPLACTGTGCQGVPPAPPIFATPSSVTFNGVGNFEPQPKAVGKARGKSAKCRKRSASRKCVGTRRAKKKTTGKTKRLRRRSKKGRK